MLLWIWTAMAITPEELSVAAETAKEQLTLCETAGCGPEEGAKAAFVVAVHRYQDEGVADGRLAATVRHLDPTLFAELPDVVQQAATSSPWAWATETPSLRERMPLSLFDPGAAPDCGDLDGLPFRKLRQVTLEVVDGEKPVPTAGIYVSGVPDRHAVNMEAGTWTSGQVYQTEDGELGFPSGCMVPFRVTAPGYRPVLVSYAVRGRNNHVLVRLEPWTPTPDGTPEGDDAIDGFATWGERYQAHLDAPTDATWEEAELARLEGAVAARAWMESDGGAEARGLCLAMGSRAYCDEG